MKSLPFRSLLMGLALLGVAAVAGCATPEEAGPDANETGDDTMGDANDTVGSGANDSGATNLTNESEGCITDESAYYNGSASPDPGTQYQNQTAPGECPEPGMGNETTDGNASTGG